MRLLRCERRSSLFMLVMVIPACITLAFVFYGRFSAERAAAAHQFQEELVRRYGLTDLCLFTDARYTRHPALADHSSAFQDHPFAPEHFPSGMIMPPPQSLKGRGRE